MGEIFFYLAHAVFLCKCAPYVMYVCTCAYYVVGVAAFTLCGPFFYIYIPNGFTFGYLVRVLRINKIRNYATYYLHSEREVVWLRACVHRYRVDVAWWSTG